MCRPDLIEYNKLTKVVPTYNLNNAFNVAEDRLGLTRLLDPEGRLFQPCRFVNSTSILYVSVELGLSVKKLHNSGISCLQYKTSSCILDASFDCMRSDECDG